MTSDVVLEIEKFIAINPDVTPMDAILTYCEEHEIEPEAIAPIIKGSLKDKVMLEAKALRMMKDNSLTKSLV